MDPASELAADAVASVDGETQQPHEPQDALAPWTALDETLDKIVATKSQHPKPVPEASCIAVSTSAAPKRVSCTAPAGSRQLAPQTATSTAIWDAVESMDAAILKTPGTRQT